MQKRLACLCLPGIQGCSQVVLRLGYLRNIGIVVPAGIDTLIFQEHRHAVQNIDRVGQPGQCSVNYGKGNQKGKNKGAQASGQTKGYIHGILMEPGEVVLPRRQSCCTCFYLDRCGDFRKHYVEHEVGHGQGQDEVQTLTTHVQDNRFASLEVDCQFTEVGG